MVGLLLARPLFHVGRAIYRDHNQLAPLPRGVVDDASRLNRSAVSEVWDIPRNPVQAEEQLRQLLQKARASGKKVSIAGTRHTMGGHTIYPDGIVLNMLPFNHLELDEPNQLLRAGAGARWFEILKVLDARGLSVMVMQANSDFTVGGSLSANCHGWQYGKAPIACSVESFRIMLADGRIWRCSRSENSELFGLALGGYGLFGVILSAELRLTTNAVYVLQRQVVPVEKYVATLSAQEARTPAPAMVYGRLSLDQNRILSECVLNIYRPVHAPVTLLKEHGSAALTALKRGVFRGSAEDEYGKRLRWNAEKYLEPHLSPGQRTRNALLSERAEWFANRSTNSTDILIETFVPPEKLSAFVHDLRSIIPQNQLDLLNLTIRHVRKDEDTFLRYADRDMVATVMLFQQARTPEAEKRMEKGTQQIIDAALEQGGRYYLPYRLHATPAQFRKAYPQAAAFFELKRKYDPEGLFQNMFFLRYEK